MNLRFFLWLSFVVLFLAVANWLGKGNNRIPKIPAHKVNAIISLVDMDFCKLLSPHPDQSGRYNSDLHFLKLK